MKRYILKRIAQAALTTYVVFTLGFVMIRAMPGGIEDYIMVQMLESGADPARARRLAEIYLNINPAKPVHVAYVDYLKSLLLHANFGKSIYFQKPVADIIFQALPWTVFLMSMALLISFAIGIGLGGTMAYVEGGKFDIGATLSTLFANSVPYYITALLLLLFLAYRVELFPVAGAYPDEVQPGVNLAFMGGVFYHAILPVASMVVGRIGGVAIGMRANSIQIIGEDYIRVAQLRGLPTSRISTRYVSHNAVLPLYTSFMISVGSMFGGSVILEEIFRYPGIGYYFFRGVNARDYPLMMGAFVLTAVTVIAAILIADLTYSAIDPRVTVGGEANANR